MIGIRHRACYQTRHTFATLNLMAGANPMWVSRQMGHASMKMLLERYSKWIDREDQSRECSKIENLINMSPEEN
jgi:integrase